MFSLGFLVSVGALAFVVASAHVAWGYFDAALMVVWCAWERVVWSVVAGSGHWILRSK